MSNYKESPNGRWLPTDISPSRLKTFKTCPKQYEYNYVRKFPRTTGIAALQGSTLHEVFLEEYILPSSPYMVLDNGIRELVEKIDAGDDSTELDANLKEMLLESNGNIDDLVELMIMDLQSRLDTEDPRDYKTNALVDAFDKKQGIEQMKIWGKGLLVAIRNGKDDYGNAVRIPPVAETEVEGCCEIELPSGVKLRLRGYIDLLFEDGSIGDLKMASDYWKAIWTLAKAISEDQPAMYAKMTGARTFRYLIVDKKRAKSGDAYAPMVRTIDFEVTDRDMEKLIEDLELFVKVTDIMNDHENGLFPPKPEYNGQTKATAGRTELNFCGKLCNHKEICFNENFKR